MTSLFHRLGRKSSRRTSDNDTQKGGQQQHRQSQQQHRQEEESSPPRRASSDQPSNHNNHHSWIPHPRRRRRSHAMKQQQQQQSEDFVHVRSPRNSNNNSSRTGGGVAGGIPKAAAVTPSSPDSIPPSATASLSSSSPSPAPSPDEKTASAVAAAAAAGVKKKKKDVIKDNANDETIPILVDEERDPNVQAALRHRFFRCPHGNGSVSGSGPALIGTACTCAWRDGDEGEDFQNSLTRAVTALDRSGNEYFAAGDYDQAMLRYERALLLKRTTLHVTPDGGGKDGGGGGGGPAVSSDPTAAAAGPTDDSSLQRGETAEQRANIMASVATSINNMTYLKQRAGLATTDETMASYLKSLQMKREILGPDHLSVGKTLNNIGSVFYLKKEYEPALAAYKDARRIMEDKLGSDHCDVGTVMSNIGDVYYATNRKDEALGHYRSALDVRWAKLGPQDPKVIRLMRQVAALETGQQPEKDDDENSLSESWDDGQEGDDGLFMASVQDLSNELKDDMKYFDLVQRDMQISMVKDKMRIFREMRDLYQEDDDDGDDDEDAENDLLYLSKDYGKTDGETDATSSQTFDPSSDGSVPDDRAALLGDSLLPLSLNHEGGLFFADAEEERKGKADQLASPKGQQQQQEETSALGEQEGEGMAVGGVLALSSAASAGLGGLPESATTPVPSRTARERKLNTYRASPSPNLSIEQRKEALVTVRDRLARLRAERSSFSESTDDGDVTNQISGLPLYDQSRKKSYMFPTAASKAKATPPIK